MSEDTYLESKSSIKNVIKKKRTSLMSKKWRREVKQQIVNENMFKRSKEKKLDFSINESPLGNKKEAKNNKQKLKNSVTRLRNELIQDDSEDEEYEIRTKEFKTSFGNKEFGFHSGNKELEGSSFDSNPLQKIIEQRMMESSSDSEESEDELDDDYDIGIDDIDLGTEDDDEIHTATEVEESNILNESMESRVENSMDYHKRRLKDTLIRGRDISPFTDVIEKGLDNYMNIGFKREIKLKNYEKSNSKLKNYSQK